MGEQNQPQTEPKKKVPYVRWIIIAVVVIFLASIVSVSLDSAKKRVEEQKKAEESSQLVEQPQEQKTPEEMIEKTVEDYYGLLGSKNFGDAYEHISNSSNISRKEYVDAVSQKGDLVAGLNEVSFNYVEISGDGANVSATMTWEIIANPLVDGDTSSQEKKVKLLKENDQWKIIYEDENENEEAPEVDSGQSNIEATKEVSVPAETSSELSRNDIISTFPEFQFSQGVAIGGKENYTGKAQENAILQIVGSEKDVYKVSLTTTMDPSSVGDMEKQDEYFNRLTSKLLQGTQNYELLGLAETGDKIVKKGYEISYTYRELGGGTYSVTHSFRKL